MKIIKQMLEDQKSGKRINIEDYYDDTMSFYDDFEVYKLLNLDNSVIQHELNILITTVKEENNDRIFYLDKNLDNDFDYLKMIQKLLVLYHKDKQSAYEEAFKFIKAPREFNKLIIEFKASYLNADLYINDLASISNYVFNSNYNKTDKPKEEIIKEQTYADILLDKIYNSNLSITDYSFYYSLGEEFNKKTINKLSRIDKDKYNEIKNRKDTTIKQILSIIDKINKNDLPILDYYDLTKLNPIILNQIALKYNVKTYIFKEYLKTLNSPYKTNLKKELTTPFIISEKLVDNDTKEKAFKILEEKEIPQTVINYKAMVRSLLK